MEFFEDGGAVGWGCGLVFIGWGGDADDGLVGLENGEACAADDGF